MSNNGNILIQSNKFLPEIQIIPSSVAKIKTELKVG